MSTLKASVCYLPEQACQNFTTLHGNSCFTDCTTSTHDGSINNRHSCGPQMTQTSGKSMKTFDFVKSIDTPQVYMYIDGLWV